MDLRLLKNRGKYANKIHADDTGVVLPGFDPAQLLFNDLQVCVHFLATFLTHVVYFSVYMGTRLSFFMTLSAETDLEEYGILRQKTPAHSECLGGSRVFLSERYTSQLNYF